MTPEEIANTYGLSAQDSSLGLSAEPTGFGLSASPAEWNVAPLDSGSWSVLESPLSATAAPENILQAPVQSEVVSPFGLMSQAAQPAPTQTNTLALQSPQIPPPPTGTIVSPQSEYAPPTSSDGQWVYSGGQWWPNETVSVGLPEEPQAATDPTTLGYEQMVRDAYGSVGRTGMGDAASNIDQAGFDYWLNTLQSGASTPDAFQRNFQTAVSDYLGKNPQDQYSTYVADYLAGEETRKATAEDLNKAFGAEGGAAAYFNQNPDVAEAYAKDSMGMSPKDFAEAHYNQYGSKENRTDLNTSKILSGFKYANDAGLTEASMKKTLGEDVFNTYKTGFADYAKTGIANILADDQLSFDEARTAVKFGRDYGYDAQKMADLTGTDKKVFDAIYKGYDDTTNRIVDSVLGGEDVKTDADRVVKALALQKQFGFTDEDLAKASDYDVAKLKKDLDPVRNFGTDLNKILTNTDSTLAETKNFLDKAKTNGAISQLYETNLGALDTKIAEMEDRWKGYDGVDPMHAQRVFDQLGQQRNALGDKYYQGTFGDPLKMAATLAKKGIDTLADLGQKDKFQAATATQDGSGRFGRLEYIERGEDSGFEFVPLTEAEQATLKDDGTYQKKLGTVVIDKDTGEEIAGLDGTIASEKSGKSWNRKRNELNVKFTDSGVPVLYTTKEKTGFGAALQQVLPVLSVMLPFMLPGIGAGLSGMLPGAGVAASGATAAIAPTLMNQALTQGILSGGLGALGGQDFGKSFLSGAINPVINTGIGSLLPKGLDANAARAITGAGTGVVKGALQGGDFSDLLGQGVLSGLTNYGLGEATRGLNLTPQQLNFATGIALPLAQGQKVNPVKLATTLASATR